MSKKIDYNMKFRNELNSLNSFIYSVYSAYSKSEQQRDYYMKLFYTLTFTNRTHTLVENSYSFIKNNDLKEQYVNSYTTRSLLMSMIIVNDLYVKLSHDFVTGRLSNKDNTLLNMIINAINKKDTTILLADARYISTFVDASLSFIDATAYEKIALLSALDEKDIDLLSSFNPFFKEEYDHYNVTLDADFFIRQISKWLIGKNALNITLEKSAEFIIDMSYADPDKIDDFIDTLSSFTDNTSKLDEAIATGDIDVIKSILNKFYIDTLSELTDSPNKLEEAIANGDVEFIKQISNKFYEEKENKKLKR